MPRVSVVLTVYNGGAYLLEAVHSVLDQTYDDFELLIVDDASTDSALSSLPLDPRIRIVRNDRNIGQIPSLNRGLHEARGEYIARLDHDDVCLPRRLERQVELLDRVPEAALTATWVDVVDANGRLWTHVRPRIESFADFACHVVTGRVHLVHPSVMFRRDLVVELGGFDEKLNAAEDQDLYRRLVLARRDVRVVTETLLRYRRHEQQMTVAKAAAVWQSDARSYDGFLETLSPGSPASTVRYLMRNDPRLWTSPDPGADWLERFLDEAASLLRLDDQEEADLAAAIAHSVAAAIVSGWAGDGDPLTYPSRVRSLAAFVSRHGDGTRPVLAAATPLLAASARVGAVVGRGRSVLGRALRGDAVARLRATARGSRFLRTLYARVVDTRARDY